jgi:hypothetical protein
MTHWDYVEFDLAINYQSDNFIVPIKLLCTAPSYVPGNTDEAAAYIKHWALNLNLVSPEDKLLRPELAQGSASAFRNASIDNLKIYTSFALLILALDDILDEAWQALGSKENIIQVFKLFTNILAGQNFNINDSTEKLNFPKLLPLLAAFKAIYNQLNTKQLNTSYFVLSMKQFFNYLLKEFEYRQNYSKLSLDEYLAIRAIVGGLDPSCELVYSLQSIDLSPDIRSNKKFLLLKDLAYKALIIANDILSLAKEIRQGNTSDNYILIKQANEQSSLKMVILEFQQYYNNMIVEMSAIKAQLLADTPNKNVTAAIAIIEEQMQAHLDWALQTARYHDKKVSIIRANTANLTAS